jgi:hypothetical protein
VSETMCCPLGYAGDGDGPTCYKRTFPVARKDYTCAECRETILKGTKHEADSGLWDGAFDTVRTCLSCAEIRNHFLCGGSGYEIGQLWEDLENNFFPDMKAGGPCLDGLSPEAKYRLFEERLKWVFENPPSSVALPPSKT